MTLSDEEKKKIEEEEYRNELRLKTTSKKKWYQTSGGIIALLILFFPVGLFLMWKHANWNKTAKLIITGIFVVFIIVTAINDNSTDTPASRPEPTNTKETNQKTQEQSVLDIEVNGQKVSVGDSADSVFEIITDKYKIDSPTIQEGKITHHFLIGNILYDMTFERNETGDYYILSKIVIIDTNYQASNQQETSPPVQYTIGYTSGSLATLAVLKGTTNDELIELLNYFHNVHKDGELSRTMKGHTVISIFDDERWIVEENYERIIRDGTYCDYIRADYSIDNSGVERASISDGNCPNYNEITF